MSDASDKKESSSDPESDEPLTNNTNHSNYWIFVAVDHLIGYQKIPAIDILRDRLEQKTWIVNSKNPKAKCLREGDEVVFYLGSSLGKKAFAGIGTLASKPYPLAVSEITKYGRPSSEFDRTVALRDTKMWEQVKPAAELVPMLGFIKNKRSWGAYLEGGIISLPKSDFELIIKA